MSEKNGQIDINWETLDGATWASHDDSICRAYAGQWIVALPGKIIASGDDLDKVAKEAAAILNLDPKTVVVQSIVHPDEWFKEYPHNTDVSTSQPAVSMTISLPTELERFVTDHVASGAFATPIDVIRVGLELLREQEMIDQFTPDQLRSEIMIGVEQADRGDLSPFDPKVALAELRSKKVGG